MGLGRAASNVELGEAGLVCVVLSVIARGVAIFGMRQSQTHFKLQRNKINGARALHREACSGSETKEYTHQSSG